MNPVINITTRLVTDGLSDDELAAIYNAAYCGFDPKPVLGYEKAKTLFTEIRNGVPRVHQETLDALGSVVQERLAR